MHHERVAHVAELDDKPSVKRCYVIVKTVDEEPWPLSGFTTVIVQAPVVAVELTVMFTVIWVAEFQVTLLTVIPLAEKLTVAPLTKLVPAMTTF
jgi:hypothetical protein